MSDHWLGVSITWFFGERAARDEAGWHRGLGYEAIRSVGTIRAAPAPSRLKMDSLDLRISNSKQAEQRENGELSWEMHV
jgi:hypothetical protein